MPQPSTATPPAQTRTGRDAAIGAATVGALAVAAPPAAVSTAAAATVVLATKTLTASILAAFVGFLTQLRQTHQTWLSRELAPSAGNRDDLAEVLADEMRLENEFAHNSADRVASALPTALAIADPTERAAAVRKILADEERYAKQRTEAMAARAFSALARLSLRRTSPAGAYWQLGQAHKHTEGCVKMAGHFWPWEVLDRVHPPRHYGCTGKLLGYDEAIAAGLMSPGDVPDLKTALRQAAGVMQEGVSDALIRELEVRDALLELGVDADALKQIDMEGVSDGTADAVPPSQ